MSCKCKSLQAVFEGKAVADIQALSELQELKTDFKTWTTLFQCPECGQYWEEKFEESGHGEVPIVKKVSRGKGVG